MEVWFAEELQGAFATSGAGCTHLYMHAPVRVDSVLVANSGEGGTLRPVLVAGALPRLHASEVRTNFGVCRVGPVLV